MILAPVLQRKSLSIIIHHHHRLAACRLSSSLLLLLLFAFSACSIMFRFLLRNVLGRPAVLGSSVVVSGVAAEATTHGPSHRVQRSQLYHTVADDVITPLLLRRLDPEVAHEWALQLLQRGWAPKHRPCAVEQRIDVSNTLWDKTFLNPIGCAAGFDKNGVAIQGLLDLGFSFCEVGSVTPKPQPGNQDRPRLFRLPADRALINRYGCNSDGMAAVEHNLQAFHQHRKEPPAAALAMERWLQSQYESLPSWLKSTLSTMAATVKSATTTTTTTTTNSSRPQHRNMGVIGVNLAKNLTTINSADTLEDFMAGIRTLGPYADYVVLNISSPNTPGLRQEHQDQLPNLRRLLQQVVPLAHSMNKPLLVKLSPDITIVMNDDVAVNDKDEEKLFNDDQDHDGLEEQLQSGNEWYALAQVLLECSVDGVVVCNTTVQRPPSLVSAPHLVRERGGLSGRPLRDRSTDCIRKLYAASQGRLVIIGAGGVSSGQDVYDKLKAGASLVQVYTALVYDGPGLVSRLRCELAQLLLQQGERKILNVIGQDHEEIMWNRRREQLRQSKEDEEAATITIIDEVDEEIKDDS